MVCDIICSQNILHWIPDCIASRTALALATVGPTSGKTSRDHVLHTDYGMPRMCRSSGVRGVRIAFSKPVNSKFICDQNNCQKMKLDLEYSIGEKNMVFGNKRIAKNYLRPNARVRTNSGANTHTMECLCCVTQWTRDLHNNYAYIQSVAKLVINWITIYVFRYWLPDNRVE